MRLLIAFLIGGVATAAHLCAQNASPQYAFWTLAGRSGPPGAIDGPGSTARFNRPWGVAVDAQGNVYVTEAINHLVRKITPDGVVSTVAGRAGEVGREDGLGTAARFAAIGTNPSSSTATSAVGPFGIAVDNEGIGYVADGNSHTLRRFTSAGLVTTFSGTAGSASLINGAVAQALYQLPLAVAVDATGNIFVADTYNHVIRRISATGNVTTIAGSAGAAGSADGIGSAARFLHPTAIAVSPTGTVYAADSNNTVRRLSPTGQDWSVETLAGSALTFGTADGTGPEARFGAAPTPASTPGGQTVSFPSFSPILSSTTFIGTSYRLGDLPGLAADAAGNVYVSDFSNNTIRKISPSGVVTTIGGSTAAGATDGLGINARFQRPCGIAVDAAGTLYIADSFNHAIRKGALPTPPVIQAQSGNQTVTAGANIVLTVAATGSPTPTIQWSRNGTVIPGATTSILALNNIQATQGDTYFATLTNAAGTALTLPMVVTVMGPPVITIQPSSQNLTGGQTVTLTSTVTAFPAATYQWLRDGVPVAGQTNASLVLSNVQDAHAGEYRVVVTNSLGSTTSNVARVAVNTGRIINLSIRSALVGSDPLIAGFVVANGSKPLLIRAVGPGLRQFGVGSPMADPQLTLQVRGGLPSTNDNWSNAPSATPISTLAAQVGAFPLAEGSLDAAVVATVTNNEVTAQTSARDSTGGVVLLELFETGGASIGRLVNVSTRAQVGVGENALFAGFVLGGNSPRTLLIRAIGPTLGAFGVSDTLADPVLQVFAEGVSSPRATNDNWNGDAILSSVFARVGAFPLPATSSRDAAVVMPLAPGNYSVRVAGVGDTTGVVLLEIYEVQ